MLLALLALRIGLVGTDTSHATAFTKLIHESGARVVAMVKGGSPDVEESRTRVEEYFEELKTKYGVQPVDSIRELCAKVDAIMINSIDGRVHLAQAREAFACGKPVFIDKPLAATLDDALAIARLARDKGVPWFSASALRFSTGLDALRIPGMNGAMVWGPGPIEPHHYLEMSWYGVHAVELLYTLLGPGCVEVVNTSSAEADVATGRWSNGRIGTVRLIRPYSHFGAATFSPKAIAQSSGDLNTGYAALVAAILEFFRTGKPPIDPAETLELFAFMDAAQRSKAAGGVPMKVTRSVGPSSDR